jgi:hypothetical protein
MVKKSVLILFMLFCEFNLIAQWKYKKPEIDIAALVQNRVDLGVDTDNIEEWIESLYNIYQKPLDLNSISIEELEALHLLSPLQINSIINHRKKFGAFINIYEIQAVPGIDIETAKVISAFLEVKNKGLQIAEIKNAEKGFLLLRAEPNLNSSPAYEKSLYAGSASKIYSRFQYSTAKQFSFGIVAEKDAGEKSLVDHLVYHAQIQNKKAFKNLLLGSYTASFGQGLIFAGNYALSKGAESIYALKRNQLGFRPYNSVIEAGYFNGLSSTFSLKGFEISTMLSFQKKDANLTVDDNQESYFSSLLESGLHRSSSELLDKDAIQARDVGINLNYKNKNLQLGLSGLYSGFNKEFIKSDQIYNSQEFTGKENWLIGPNFSWVYQNINAFGEMAISKSKGKAFTLGLMASLGLQWEYALNLRNIDPHFHSFYGNAFTESYRTINEKGVYQGLKFTPSKKIKFNAYFDIFSSPGIKFDVFAPSQGKDAQIRMDYKPSKQKLFFIAYHTEQKEKNTDVEVPIRYLSPQLRHTLSMGYDKSGIDKWRWQSKLYLNARSFEGPATYGFALVQDAERKSRYFNILMRAAYFKAEDFNNRIYAFENDVLYAISFPAYYGEGLRYYAVIKYPFSPKTQLWLRIASTKKLDNKPIGSGNDAVGLQKTDLKIQIKYDF